MSDTKVNVYSILEETYQELITNPEKKEWLESNWKSIMLDFADQLIEKVESSLEAAEEEEEEEVEEVEEDNTVYGILKETYQELITNPEKKEWLESNWKSIMLDFADQLFEKVESSLEAEE